MQNENLEINQTSTETTVEPTQKPNFDQEAFFESLNKRANDFFNNTAKKQLENKFGMSEDEIKALIDANKQKQGNDIETLKSENETLKNEIKNIKKSTVINNIMKDLDVNTEKQEYLLKLANLDDVFDEKGDVDTSKVTDALNSVLEKLPEFKNSKKEPEFGKYSEPNTKTEPNEQNIFGFDFNHIR